MLATPASNVGVAGQGQLHHLPWVAVGVSMAAQQAVAAHQAESGLDEGPVLQQLQHLHPCLLQQPPQLLWNGTGYRGLLSHLQTHLLRINSSLDQLQMIYGI